ncbi:Clavaminate synthase-like protein [Mycena sanguinolenta]|uniref:Clavaminate synthase-like protein n=1 Tax=Mycena sanguinolenta TaxID=230812 RepID=A0A8H7D9B7_9AGAR|nr:Clavaminate synthase-like protein [Mycena sanguinolenta]
MSNETLPTSDIQIVDFGPFLDGSDKRGVADKIVSSFKQIGFVYLMNHGIPAERSAEMFQWVGNSALKLTSRYDREDLDLTNILVKAILRPAHGNKKILRRIHHLGRTTEVFPPRLLIHPLYAIAEQRAQAPDVKESFECGREEDELQPNIWLPDGTLPGFKEACLDFFWLCHEVELNILRALALGLGLAEGYFLQYHTVPDNQLRLLHYPSVPIQALEAEKITRIGAHSDFGSITLLLQDDVGGLEVEDPHQAGSFCPAPPVPGALVVNAGSNDTIRSTIHRVRAPRQSRSADGMTPERYSIPYFCCADFGTIVDCIPGTWDDERPKKYEPISAQEYIMKRMLSTY